MICTMNFRSRFLSGVLVVMAAVMAVAGCSDSDGGKSGDGDTSTLNGDTSSNSATGDTADTATDTGQDTDTPSHNNDTNTVGSTDSGTDSDVLTCEMAAEHRTYEGCDFWPTVTYNQVWYNYETSEGFEFAVVVANNRSQDAAVQVTGGALTQPIATTVPAGELRAIVLPWVESLKGTQFTNPNTSGDRATASVRQNAGAYHLTSSTPVTVWQFSPLEYQLDPEPVGCIDSMETSTQTPTQCLSVTNDASLLLPSTALTGSYRVFTYGGENGGAWGDAPGAIAITATQDNTLVRVQLTGGIAAGTGVAATAAGEVVEYTMNAGDVVQLLGAAGASGMDHADLSGSAVVGLDAANPGSDANLNYKSVQVIGLSPILEFGSSADHVEESVLPAEALGHHYLIAPPTGPTGVAVAHRVRLVGSVDGTVLTYGATVPTGAPTSLNAGQVAEVESTTPFTVTAQDENHPFMAVSYMSGTEPSVSAMVTPAQFRMDYSFLAPISYEQNYIDILAQSTTTIQLDGAALTVTGAPIDNSGWLIYRVPLTSGPAGDGKHYLEADAPVGLQVMGFGHATSYYYPGGLNLEIISEPLVVIVE
ncbi:MAG: hypothetical protein JXR76_19920 [Deltaproteobacteria bacterium]|nr:hypothetical protein [Deltaproteobacteria bacterium]